MHTNSTTNYNLPQFLPTDKPAWLTDVNPAYLAIDAGMKANADAAEAAQTDATQALADAAGASATATQADAKASGAVASLSELFLDTATYGVGEYVIFNNILYVCIEPVTTPGPWTGSVNWARASLDSIATDLKAAVTAVNNKTGSDIPSASGSSESIADALAAIPGFRTETHQVTTSTSPYGGYYYADFTRQAGGTVVGMLITAAGGNQYATCQEVTPSSFRVFTAAQGLTVSVQLLIMEV